MKQQMNGISEAKIAKKEMRKNSYFRLFLTVATGQWRMTRTSTTKYKNNNGHTSKCITYYPHGKYNARTCNVNW